MAKYCGKCGSLLDLSTGKCPLCDKGTQAGETVKPDMTEGYPSDSTGNTGGSRDGSCFRPNAEQNIAPNAPVTQQSFFQGAAYAPPAQVKPPVKSKNTALRIIITCLLWILFFAFFAGLTAVVLVRNFISSDGVAAMIENVDIEDALEGFREFDIDGLYAEAKENLGDALGKVPTDKQLESLIKDTSIKDFISDKLGDAAEAFLDGEEASVRIGKREIDTLLRENKSEIERIFGVSVSSDDLNSVTERLFDESNELTVITGEELADRVPAVFYAVRYGLSYFAVAVLAVFCLTVFIIMAFTNFSLTGWLCGVTMSLAGLACILLSSFGITDLFGRGSVIYRVSLLVRSVFSASLTYSVIITVIGVLLIVSAIVSIIINKNKARQIGH